MKYTYEARKEELFPFTRSYDHLIRTPAQLSENILCSLLKDILLYPYNFPILINKDGSILKNFKLIQALAVYECPQIERSGARFDRHNGVRP